VSPKKLWTFIFRQNFIKFPPTAKFFGTFIPEEICNHMVHSNPS